MPGLLGVYTFNEFKKCISSENNKIKYTLAFPRVLIKPGKGDVSIEFELNSEEYFILKDEIVIHSGDSVGQFIRLFYESYVQRVCEMLLRE